MGRDRLFECTSSCPPCRGRIFLSSPSFHNCTRKKVSGLQAEFQAEQEYLQTLSFLSPAEQIKYKERQGVQFLYMKPPGACELDTLPAAPAKVSTSVIHCAFRCPVPSMLMSGPDVVNQNSHVLIAS